MKNSFIRNKWHNFLHELLGFVTKSYLTLVQKTNRFIIEPQNPYERIGSQMPVIAAMWHGQHFMIHFAKRKEDRAVGLVSRSRDGELNACILKWLGIDSIRGSGARGRDIRSKGGASALRSMIRALDGGSMVVMTADVPKVARVCGLGIVTLAQMSGRPIVPVAVVTSRHYIFKSWDKACIGLPFGKGAMIFGEVIFVSKDANKDELEYARRRVEQELDSIHKRAYALVGQKDPGASLSLSRKQGKK